jgi:hypothetical protein
MGKQHGSLQNSLGVKESPSLHHGHQRKIIEIY